MRSAWPGHREFAIRRQWTESWNPRSSKRREGLMPVPVPEPAVPNPSCAAGPDPARWHGSALIPAFVGEVACAHSMFVPMRSGVSVTAAAVGGPLERSGPQPLRVGHHQGAGRRLLGSRARAGPRSRSGTVVHRRAAWHSAEGTHLRLSGDANGPVSSRPLEWLVAKAERRVGVVAPPGRAASGRFSLSPVSWPVP